MLVDALGLIPVNCASPPTAKNGRRCSNQEKKVIESAIGDHVADIQHVGSTSIPGMSAKPILDIAVAVENFEKARACIAPLVAPRLHVPRRERHTPQALLPEGRTCTHHIHMVEETSEEWTKLIRFTDLLKADPKTAEGYRKLKLDLWERTSRRPQSLPGRKGCLL